MWKTFSLCSLILYTKCLLSACESHFVMNNEEPEITVQQGKLRGAIRNGLLGGNYISFRGIPYAAPPIGALRFKDPEPPASWSGVRDASKPAEMCIQSSKYPPVGIVGKEDCLYLNVFTPTLTGNLPVMVWIHGGGFMSGTENNTRPDYLLRKGVMVVTINYRLGPFGFLNLDHKKASGNQGLKDQVAALKWIRQNIASFGGDPNNVTIFGNSAGGALVHLLTLSPMAKGLFQKAIIQSGVAYDPWCFTESNSNITYKLAEVLGKNSEDPEEVIDFLRTIPASEIIEALPKVQQSADPDFIPFTPNVDAVADNPFLPLPIEELRENQVNVPYLIGHASHEYLMYFKDWSDEGIQKYDTKFEEYVRKYMKIKDPEKVKLLSEELRAYYGLRSPLNRESMAGIVQWMSDLFFVNGVNEVVEERRRNNNTLTYFYKMSYVVDALTATKLSIGDPPIRGTAHADEMPLIFYLERGKDRPSFASARDKINMERFTTMWTNFAKFGNPTPSLDEYVTTLWQPVTKDEYNCLYIDEDLKFSTFKHKVADIYRKYVE